MEIALIVLLILGAYLLGSIPTAVWWGKKYYGIDVREFGSGNAGATNTFRVLGKKAGIPVLIIDILKGTAAVMLALLSPYKFESDPFVNVQLGLGVAAVVGHVFPLFAGFRGGKGVATILGVIICITPLTSSMVAIVFLMVLMLSQYVSLSSMIAGISFPFFLHFQFHNENKPLMIYSILIAALLIITHRQNIGRLLKRQESKVNLFAKSKA